MMIQEPTPGSPFIQPDPIRMLLPEYIDAFKAKMKHVYHDRGDVHAMALKRGTPPYVMREVMSMNPLAVGIPAEYGGRGGHIKETLALLEAASYESLSLSLMLGINIGLFLQPVAKYAQEEVKREIFNNFLHKQQMGGLMITEPGHGSDALNMKTNYTQQNGIYHLQGHKHWAGLTGWADYWLLAAREKDPDDALRRDIGFFICNVNTPGQQIVVEEVFENLGLYQIPYGRNRIDVKIPALYKLVPKTNGINMMLDMLHRNRMIFPGMAMGFIQRMLDEALAHTRKRQIAGTPLIHFDQVQQRLASLQTSYTITSAMCLRSSELLDNGKDLPPDGIEVNSVKTVVTDLMQDAAQSVTQLFGAQAYKLDHIAGRGIIDSRPFQIFEGSNDILYSQITGGVLKMMRKLKERNLFRFLKEYPITIKAADYLKKILDFEINAELPQRKMVELGEAIGRIVAFEMVIDLGSKGFHPHLIRNGLEMLQHEIAGIINGFNTPNNTTVIEDYQHQSTWHSFC
jgi:alkylation response protein AidB-like acyl-CoA dehydrogenase